MELELEKQVSNSAVRILEISNRIVTSVFDSKRAQLFKIFEYLPSSISYLFNRMMLIFHLSNTPNKHNIHKGVQENDVSVQMLCIQCCC